MGCKDAIPHGVLFVLCIMNAAVNLDDEMGFGTQEVNDEAINDFLATKMESREAMCAQMLPKDGFRRRHRMTQFPRALLEIPLMTRMHNLLPAPIRMKT